MARKRMIDPQIWASEDYSELSHFAQLIWIGLFSQADDEGRGKSKPAYLKSILFPYSEDIKLVKKVDLALNEIAKVMSITFYQLDNNEYYQLENWSKWQKVDKPQQSKIPLFSDGAKIIRKSFAEHSPNNSRKVDEQSATIPLSISPNKNKKENRIEKEKKENENIQACACDSLNKFTFQELVNTCEKISPVIFQRHKKNLNNDYRLGLIYEEVSINSTLEDIEKLLVHANKTYIVQPKYNTLDLCWVLNNQKTVMSAKELTTIENNSKPRDYDSEE